MQDIIIIGGGPVGLLSAIEAAKKGLSPLILEEHREIGVPDHCAGLVSVKGMRKLGIKGFENSILNKVKNAIIHSPSDFKLQLIRENTQAYVFNREKLDKWLSNIANSLGVEIKLKSKVLKIKRKNKKIIVYTNKEKHVCHVVIIAWGAKHKPGKYGVLPALQYELKKADLTSSDTVELFFTNMAPDFFVWLIPTGDRKVRIGVATRFIKPKTILTYFIKKLGLDKSNIEKARGGIVLTRGPLKRTFDKGVIIVGDAAGQVKPTTGGGIVTGGLCGKIAGRIAVESVTYEDNSEKFLSRYQKEWEKTLGKEFKTMKFVRMILDGLNKETIDKLIPNIKRLKLNKVIEKYGDIDFQKLVVKKIFTTNLNFVRFLPLIFQGLINYSMYIRGK